MVTPLQSASGGTANVNNQTVTFPNNVQAGTKLIAWIVWDAGGTTSVSSVQDGSGNSFTVVPGMPTPSQAGGPDFVGVYCYTLDTPPGDVGTKPSIKVTTAGVVSDLSMLIQEVPGLQAGDAHDGTPGVNIQLPTSSMSQPAYTSAAPGEYLTGFFGDDGQGQTVGLPSGYTADAHNINTSGTNNLLVVYKNSTGGAETGTWTDSGTSGVCGFVIVAFKLAPGAGYQGFLPPPFEFPPLSRQFGPLAPFTVPGNGDFPPPLSNPYPVMQIAATTSAFTVTRSTGAGDGITLLANVGTQVTGVTDSQGNTWILAQSDTSDQVYLAYTTYNGSPGTPTKALVAGVDTITVTGASSGLFLITGVKGVAPYAADKNPAFTRATGTAVTGPASGTLTNSNEVVLGWSAAPSASIVSSWAAPFNRVQDGQNASAASSVAAWFPPTTASSTPAATLAASGTWAAFTLALFLSPFTPPATAFTQVSRPAKAQPQAPFLSGRTARRLGVFAQLGPPVYPQRQPVQAHRFPARGGWTSSRQGVFDQLGPPVRQLRQPVRAQPQVPLLTGRTERRTGVFGQLGPPAYPLRHPVKAQPQVPLLTGRSGHLAGIYDQLGPPVRQLRQPVRIAPQPPPRGRTRSVAGTFTSVVTGFGPPVYPLRQPVQARQPLPPRGHTASIRGVYDQFGPPVYPQRQPLQAHQLPHRGGQGTAVRGVFDQLGPPVRQLRQPVQARQPLPPRGQTRSVAGTFTLVIIGAGPPVYPLRHPVRAQPGPQRGGTTERRTGIFAQLGPPVRPQTHPVHVPYPPVTRGQARSAAGTYTSVAIGQGPPVYPLREPVHSPYPPVTRGRVIRAAGTFAQAGPPVTPLRRPVGVARQQPPPPTRGRTASQRGPYGRTGPPVRALRSPLRASWPPGHRGGLTAVLHGTFTPPPLFSKATGTATVSDPREGRASAALDPREGAAKVTDPHAGTVTAASDPRDGRATVSDPREGRASPAS